MKETKIFPVECLPACISTIINYVAAVNYFSVNFLALAMLFTLGVAIGRSRFAIVKADWTVNANLFCALVGEPGSVKTHALKFALRPLLELPDDDPFVPSGEPSYSTKRHILANDTTLEGLILLLKENAYGVSVFRDELAGFFASMNRYRTAGGDEETWLSLYSSTPVRTFRKTRKEDLCVDQPFVGLIGTVQPQVLARLVHNEKCNGFWERFLFVFDDKDGIGRPWDLGATDNQTALYVADWRYTLHQILSTGGYWNGGPKEEGYSLTADAAMALQTWQNDKETLISAGAADRTLVRKLEDQAVRIALILQVAREVTHETDNVGKIELAAVENATKIADFLGSQAEAVRALKSDEDDKMEALLDLLGDEFTTADALRAAKSVELSARTFFHKAKEGYFEKVEHGRYRKVK